MKKEFVLPTVNGSSSRSRRRKLGRSLKTLQNSLECKLAFVVYFVRCS